MKKVFFTLLIILSFTFNLEAQEVRNVDVKQISTSEVQRAKTAIENSGLSPEAAMQLARLRGASEQQISDMQQRFLDLESGKSASSMYRDTLEQAIGNSEAQRGTEQSTRKASFDPKTSIFGAYLFNNSNLSFQPNTNIAVPRNYEIGIGDQIIINIWGNSQLNYQLNVNRNGQIIISDIGPIYVAGLQFDAAAKKIKTRLFSIYNDMQGENPKTFAQVNLGQLRSIKINLVGEVKSPGTYTLQATSTVFNALYLSGGPNSIGSFRNIHLIRNNTIYKTIDIYKFLIDADISDNINLKEEDIIFIPPMEKRVEVSGEFKRNAMFELKEGEDLETLLKYAGGFTDDSYLYSTQIHRKTQQGKRIIDINYNDFATTELVNGDVLTNKAILDVYENRVSIVGAVYRPGDYEWKEGLTLSELILKADSITADAYTKRGIIIRYNEDLSQSTVSFDLAKVLGGETDVFLQPEDIVNIKSHFELKENKTIAVNGEVNSPGSITYMDNITVRDAIFLANGFKESADSAFIEVARRLSYEEEAVLSDTLVHIYLMMVPRDLKIEDPSLDFVLQPFDQINVRRAPSYQQSGNVSIRGEIKYAGAFAIRSKDMRVSDLIKLAGGLSDHAYIPGATLERNYQIRGIDVPTEDVLTESSVFQNSIRSAQANLLELNLEEVLKTPGSIYDFILKKGDVITIPTITEEVRVLGEVLNSTGLVYEKGKSVKYYIDKSGGLNLKAKKSRIYVLYANGTTQTTKNLLLFKNYPEVAPGCQIVIPAKPDRTQQDNTGKILGYASTLASLALAFSAVFR